MGDRYGPEKVEGPVASTTSRLGFGAFVRLGSTEIECWGVSLSVDSIRARPVFRPGGHVALPVSRTDCSKRITTRSLRWPKGLCLERTAAVFRLRSCCRLAPRPSARCDVDRTSHRSRNPVATVWLSPSLLIGWVERARMVLAGQALSRDPQVLLQTSAISTRSSPLFTC